MNMKLSAIFWTNRIHPTFWGSFTQYARLICAISFTNVILGSLLEAIMVSKILLETARMDSDTVSFIDLNNRFMLTT